MLKRKSTAKAIPMGQLASYCSQLIKSKAFHQHELFHFTRLFNESQGEPDFSAGIPSLSNEQKYFQLQAENHRAALARIEQAINQLDQAA